MHTGTLRKLALALTFWIALHASSLKAQIFTAPLQASTTGTNPVDFEFRADGTMIARGNSGVGSLTTADQGDGTRFLWYPAQAAFRAGKQSTGAPVGSGYWDQSFIGFASFAVGQNTSAQADDSAAFGYNSNSEGPSTFTTGTFSLAYGRDAVSMGSGTTASGTYAVALGCFNTASGYSTLAFGAGTTASGAYSTSSGLYTSATAKLSFVIGTYNLGGGNPNNWVATDPIFEIGNGTSTTPSDALVVYKNGNAALQGTLEVAPGGDIPMYTGN